MVILMPSREGAGLRTRFRHPVSGEARAVERDDAFPSSSPPDKLVEDGSTVPGLLQHHLALVTQQLLELLTVQSQQQAVGVENSDLVGAHSLHPQHHIAGIALPQQFLQALEQHLGVVDGGAR